MCAALVQKVKSTFTNWNLKTGSVTVWVILSNSVLTMNKVVHHLPLQRSQRITTAIFMVILGIYEANMEPINIKYSAQLEQSAYQKERFNLAAPTLENSKISGSVPPSQQHEERNATKTNFPLSACIKGNSTDLNLCLRQLLTTLKPHLSRGIPQISIPPMEPLEIQNITFQQGSGAVSVVSEFRNIKIRGITNFLLTDLRADVSGRTLSFDMVFPQLSVTGSYELSGNVFLFLIVGDGDFYCDLTGAKAQGTSKLEVSRNNSLNRINVKKMDINLSVDNIKVHLTNLFNGDPVLGTVINNFLNENSQDVFSEVRPQIELQVGELLSKLTNLALSAVSASQLVDAPLDL